MGYDCNLKCSFTFNKPMDKDLIDYLKRFYEFRHKKLNVKKIKTVYPNWAELCYNGELGTHGEFFAPGGHDVESEVVIDSNNCPNRLPYLYSPYYVTDDGMHLDSDSGSAYSFLGWLAYYIKVFFEPNGLILNGSMEYEGIGDRGTVEVVDNKISYNGPAIADSYRRYYNPYIVGYNEPYGRLEGGEVDFDLDEYYESNQQMMDSDLYKNMVESDAYVEAIIVLDKANATRKDYEKYADTLQEYEYIDGPISISKILKPVCCSSHGNGQIEIPENTMCLFVKCHYADRIELEKASLLIPQDYREVLHNVEDLVKYELCPDAEFDHITEDFSFKRQKTTYDFGLFSIEFYVSMKVHCGYAEVNEHAFLSGDGYEFIGFDFDLDECDIENERIDTYLGCCQFFPGIKTENIGYDIKRAFSDSIKHILSGDFILSESRVESLWYMDDIDYCQNEGNQIMGFRYEKYSETVTMAYAETDFDAMIIAEEYDLDDCRLRKAYVFDEGKDFRKVIDCSFEEVFFDSLWDYADTLAS